MYNVYVKIKKYLILQSQKMFWICFVILKLCGVFLIVGNFFFAGKVGWCAMSFDGILRSFLGAGGFWQLFGAFSIIICSQLAGYGRTGSSSRATPPRRIGTCSVCMLPCAFRLQRLLIITRSVYHPSRARGMPNGRSFDTKKGVPVLAAPRK